MTSGPYREAAFVAPEPIRDVFRYVEATLQDAYCPVCTKYVCLSERKFCTPFRRQIVKVYVFRPNRICPLTDTHWHHVCGRCGAHVVGGRKVVALAEETFRSG